MAGAIALAFPLAGAAQDMQRLPDRPPLAQTDAPQQMTLPQARQMARFALDRDRPRLAYNLADGLLQADDRSAFAHFVQAQALRQMGRNAPARKAATRAYRYSDTQLHRFEAADLAARLSYEASRLTMAQVWLRRAAHHAPNPQIEEQIAQDYRRLRALNPLRFSLRVEARPTSNLNNGADSGVQTIDGLPYTGLLSGSAQALSGTVGSLDARASYRLHQTATSRSAVGTRFYLRRVALSEAAKDKAPSARNRDFASSFAEVSARHVLALGETRRADVGAALGQLWSAGSPYYSFARGNLGHDWQISGQTGLRADVSAEYRASDIDTLSDSSVYTLHGGLRHERPDGDTVALSLTLQTGDSHTDNLRYRSAALHASYGFGEVIGKTEINAGLALSYSEYPDFSAVFAVPGGRRDTALHADVNLFFPEFDYAGFAPSLRLRAGQRLSNVSRYESREFSASLGFRSKF